MLVAIRLVYLPMVIVFRWLLVPFVILCALPLAVIGAFVVLAVIGHATNIITGLAILSMAGIVVAAAILTPIGVPTVPTSPILMAILPISTNVMDSFVNMA